jgi:RHS repeat-associated protein
VRRLFVLLAILFITIPSFGQETAAQTATPPAGTSASGQSSDPREIPALRTRTSRTYAEDGMYTAQIFAGSINYQDADGQWQPIDNTLVASTAPGYAHENRANRYVVRFPARLGTAPIHIETGSEWLTISLRGASADGQASGDTETYRLPGYTLAFTVGNDAVKENITLDGPQAPQTFVYDISMSPHLTAEQTSGRIDFTGGSGTTVFSFPTPYMYDAAGPAAGQIGHVDQSLAQVGHSATVTLSADPSWLAQPGRQWPVTIDPSAYFYPDASTGTGPDIGCMMINSTPSTSYCASANAGVGNANGVVKRFLLHFNISFVPRDVQLSSALLNLYMYDSSGASTANTINADPVTRGGWTMGATWNSYDGANPWTTPGGGFTSTPAASATIPYGAAPFSYSWRITQLAQGWLDGAIANNGVIMVSSNETTNNVMQFWTSQPGAPSSEQPYLQLHYAFRTGEQSFDTMVGFNLTDGMDMGVNVTNGNLLVHQTDFAMDGVGLPLTLDRYYNSLDYKIIYGGFGLGWSNGMALHLSAIFSDGAPVFFGPSFYAVHFNPNPDGTYTSPPALESTLGHNADGSYALTGNRSREKLTFDSYGNVLSDVDRSGNRMAFNYMSTSNGMFLNQVTDTQGRATIFSPIESTSGMATSQVQDPAGRLYRYTYDSTLQTLMSYTDPNNQTTYYSYSNGSDGMPNGILEQITDPSGAVTKIGYTKDSSGWARVSWITQPSSGTGCPTSGCTTTFTYTSPGQTTVTDPNGHATFYTYDALGRVTAVQDASGHTWQTSWTGDNQVASATTPGGHTTTYTYDGLNNLTQVTLPTGPSFHWAYANSAWPYQPSSFTDEEGRVTSFGYDGYGRLTTTTDPLAHTWTTAYNANGTVASDTDANNHTTSYSYYTSGVNLGLVSQITPPAPLGAETFTYDSANRTLTDIDGKGQKTQYSYDPLDRVTGMSFSKASGVLESSIGYAYDAVGDTLSMSDSTGTTGYTYDVLGEPLSETLPTSVHLSDGHSVDYTYDPAGNLASKTDGGGTTSYTYRPDDLPQMVIDPLGGKTVFMYDLDDDLGAIVYPNSISEDISHDISGQVTRVNATTGSSGLTTTLNSYTYSYANPTTLKPTTTRYSVTDYSGNKTTYTYDAAGRLNTATQKSSAGAQLHSYSYAYDPAGNMTADTIDGSQATMSFNAADELTQENGATSMALQYDANGNQTNTELTSALSDNAQDQTSSMTVASSGAVQNMTYTGRGQSRRTINGPTGGATSYQYDMTGMGSSTTGSTTTYYTTGPDGELLSERIPNGSGGWNAYYYLYDGLGSVVGLVDSSGTVQDSYSYDPEGNLTNPNTQQPIANIFGYGGAVFDGKTGLYAMGERYYNPKVGRFTQLDPLGGGYGYADNNPINETDPSGLCGFAEFDAPSACPGEVIEYAEEGAAGEALPWENQVAGDLPECSFSATTSVSTPSGEVPIASLQPGDQVMAYNPSTGTTGSYTVQATWQHQDPTLESLTIDGDTLTTTPEHPFDTKEKGWVPAGKLWKGAHVRDEQGGYGVVQTIAYSRHSAVMYNLTVNTAHTYFVGAGRWLVHNACGGGRPGLLARIKGAIKHAIDFLRNGWEYKSKSGNVRIAPTGNRGRPGQRNPWYRRLPHYHRRGPGGIGRHRPWQSGPGRWYHRF